MSCWTFLVIVTFVSVEIDYGYGQKFRSLRRMQQQDVDMYTPYTTTGSRRQVLCANQCAEDNNCLSLVYDESTKLCHLYNSTLNLTSEADDTSLVYMEKNCDMSILSKDCCYLSADVTPNYCNFPIYKDCQEAFDSGERRSGEIFLLQPVKTWRIIRAVCQFDDTSGWTVIQRRLDGSVDFFRYWDDYVNGFGYLDGEYWIGLEAIYFLTRENRKISFYLEAHDGEVRTANYSTFYIDGADTNYVNHCSGYSGDAGDSWTGSGHDGKPFTTRDRDHDNANYNCAVSFTGAWWYNNCHAVNLNGQWYAGGAYTTFATGACWKSWKGHDYSYKTIYIRLSR